MKVSVIIPCYNASSYILRCLNSLENQIFKDFDVFIIDDASTDNSIEVIESYKKQSWLKVNILTHKDNKGPSFSRLQGIKASNSQYICFCDADDWYDDNFLYMMVNEQTRNNADVVFTSFRLSFDSGRSVERLNIYTNDILKNKNKILIKASDSLCLMMINRQILLDIPHPQIRNGEDMALIPLIIEKAEKVASVNKCMYNYYCREKSASMVPSMNMIDSLIKSFDFINSHLATKFKFEKEYIGVRNLLYGALINLFKISYNTKKANHILDNFEVDYPQWYNNSNISEMPFPKRVFLFFVRHRLWFMIKFLSHVQILVLKL